MITKASNGMSGLYVDLIQLTSAVPELKHLIFPFNEFAIQHTRWCKTDDQPPTFWEG